MSASSAGAPRTSPARGGGAAGERADRGGSYARGARVLSVGIASTGALTFAYFSIASHVLGPVPAKRIDLLWSIMFVTISVIYRPIEQLLSRAIAARRALGADEQSLRVPIAIQGGFALLFAGVALALRKPLTDHVFSHSSALYWVLLAGTLAYAASYFARGWLAGHEYFALFGGLVLMESLSRLCFALAVAIGLTSGQAFVALGIVAAPFVSLVVVPAAFARRTREQRGPSFAHSGSERGRPSSAHSDGERRGVSDIEELDAALAGPGTEGVEEAVASHELTLGSGSRFAFAVSGVMLAEQTLLNAAVLTVDATSANRALAGIAFNVLLIARAPLQLFQAIQTSLLPHLTGLEATEGRAAFARAVRITVLAIGAFALAVALALLAVGPFAMKHLFGQRFDYDRFGLALIGLGMGAHLVCGALNQAALARDQARAAAVCWLLAAVAFVGWMVAPLLGDQLLRTEVGYFGATALLAAMLTVLYRRGSRHPPSASAIGR